VLEEKQRPKEDTIAIRGGEESAMMIMPSKLLQQKSVSFTSDS
jgi:hypothetical protein